MMTPLRAAETPSWVVFVCENQLVAPLVDQVRLVLFTAFASAKGESGVSKTVNTTTELVTLP